MNINMVNTRFANSLQNGSAAKRLLGEKAARFSKEANAGVSKDVLGVALSISEEAKAILNDLEMLAEKIRNSVTVSEGFVSESQANTNIITATIQAEECNVSRMRNAFWHDGPNFGNLAATYAEIRQELKSRYTGDDLLEQLGLLDEDFNSVIRDIAENMESIIRAFASSGREAECEALKEVLRIMDSIEAMTFSMKDLILRLGELIRQFILEGGAVNDTEEGRSRFANYIERNILQV